MWSLALTAIAIIYALRRTIAFRQAARSVGNLPGYRTLISSNTAIGHLIPRIGIPGFIQGRNYAFNDKYSLYAWAGCDIVSHVAVFPCKANIVIADAAAIKEVGAARARFPKPIEVYGSLSFFGYNIVASEGEAWKKYRKISAPAFSDRNNKLVWDETVAIMNDLFDNVWNDKQSITVDHCLDLTLPITFFVIGIAGFGRRMTWKEESVVPKGHKMTFKQSLYTVTTYMIPRLLLPDWVMPLTKKTREIATGFEELKSYMVEMIENRIKSEKVERHDLFSNLLDANDDETTGLTTDEVIGNIFIFFLAGHETTAHTLCFTLGLLALYPDEQEKLYQHTKSVLRNAFAPKYEEMPLLTRTMAVFYETLRLFPSVTLIPKRSAEDTTLTTTNSQNETVVVPVPKDIGILIDVPGLHHNPKYWEDPETFKPDRFLKPDWNRDAFIPFSVGARACLGRRFAEMEAVAALTMLISRYKITVKEEPQFANETFQQRKDRILKTVPLLSLTPVRVPLVFTRR